MKLAKNMLAGLRLALLFPAVEKNDFHRSLSAAFLLAVVSVAVLAALSYARQYGEIYFNPFGTALVGTLLLVLTIGAIAVTRSQGSLDQLADILTPLAALLPWIAAGLSGLILVLNEDSQSSLPWLLALVWTISAIIRAIYVAFPNTHGISYLATAFVVSTLGVGGAYLGYYPDMFFSYDESEYAEYEEYINLDQEAVFISQSQLLDTQLQAISSGDPNVTEFYFVGFAGNADESVFDSEVRFVEAKIEGEFGTTGRSLVLSGDFENTDSVPLANTHNLFDSLAHIGEKMNVEDDILFLYLSSHGSKDAYIQVSMFPLQLKQLTADDLRNALDTAKIEWRIIAISACYSGSFIDSLKTEKTLVMTAAAAENTSFGCSNERDLTYFGEAYFQDSFEIDASLIERFEQAKISIKQRETEEGRSFSNPQIFVGSEIKKKLDELSSRPASVSH